MAEKSNLHKLSELGQSVWIDYLSRDMLHEGELARMMKEDAVVGVTSNPTIFQKAISQGQAYDEQLKELLERETDPKEIFLHLSADDIAGARSLYGSAAEIGSISGKLLMNRGGIFAAEPEYLGFQFCGRFRHGKY